MQARFPDAAAALAQVPFVDASGWLTAADLPAYSTGDGLHVNQAGHAHLGGRLAAALRALTG